MFNSDREKKKEKKHQQKTEGNSKCFEEPFINVQELRYFFQENPTVFLLDNILMSVQFFKNYERDVQELRENLFTEVELSDHCKTCFYADSIYKVVGTNVKFRRRHGIKKNTEELLHPLRIYVGYDNVKAAFDTSVLDKVQSKFRPHYLLSVKPCDGDVKEKSGYVYLVEYKTSESPDTETSDSTNGQSKQSFQETKNRSSTRNIGLYNKYNAKTVPESNGGTVPSEVYYKYIKSTAKLNSPPVREFRMNHEVKTSYHIPKNCFQVLDIKQFLSSKTILATARKADANGTLLNRTLLHSAAFKGYFCDVLEHLTEPLKIDGDYLSNTGVVQEEFVTIDQNGLVAQITSVIDVLDWNKHVPFLSNYKSQKANKIEWPTKDMNRTMLSFPMNLVPAGFPDSVADDNRDSEKEWKIEFAKAEEYLILHLMHSHLRCYFFALVVYKTFIEKDVNPISFGPKHLLHHLFWSVRANFLAWPDESPGESLIHYFKLLYKRLQNKRLPNFFVISRNLFENAQLKDLHRAQFAIKMILENPVPYVMKAISNIKLETDFYKTFDVRRLNSILNGSNAPTKKSNKPNETIKVNVDSNEEVGDRQWRKSVIMRLQMEKKIEEEQQTRQSIDSVDIKDIPRLDFDRPPATELLELFISHFLEMGLESVQYQNLIQAELYMYEATKLFNLLSPSTKKDKLKHLNRHFKKLNEDCAQLKRIESQGAKDAVGKSER